ncbi:MAG: carboxypeptidase-like regulatory domain-containing protein [Vicinamibacterales bacterium]
MSHVVIRSATAAALVLGLLGAPAWAQVTTGVVTGAVKDEQGAVIPGAAVTLVSDTRGTHVADAQTNANGDFVFPNIPGDTYTVEVILEGFKKVRRAGLTVSPGDRVVVPTLTLSVGGRDETVTVKAGVATIQAASGERAFTVTTQSVESLPIVNRNFAGFATLVPGTIAQTGTAIAGGVTRLGGGGQNNIMMDGVSTMDTGNNGQLISMNVDSISEVKVLTQGYQAEFGRSSGLQISAVTKSGTNQFRGSVYDIERNSDWNSNSWANMRNGDPKPLSKERDWGYTLGGPVGKPGGSNKLFFFYSHEYRPRQAGGNINRFRVPTAVERQGDFSQTRDNNGAVFNLIRDYTTGLPCTASDMRGCFQDGGVLGRIPQSRLYPTGMNVLNNLWPLPNVQQVPGLGYNYEVQVPVTKTQLNQPVLRADYQISAALRFTAKYAGQLQGQDVDPGSLPGYNDLLRWNRNRHAPSITVNYNLTPTMFLEGTYGYSFNEIANLYVSPLSNRVNAGLGDLPMLFPQAGLVDPSYNAAKVFDAANAPFYVDGRVVYPPNFTWGNRIANAPPNLGAQLANINPSHDASLSLTKVTGRHTLKAGLYWNHAYKAQQLGTAGATPFQGALSFANDGTNPLDSGFGYANAALGILSSYAQQSVVVEGAYVYNNIDWYAQDNWKVGNKLTLDYGLRFVSMQPTYDTRIQASTFFLDRWQASAAPLLYLPGCAAAAPCSGTSRQAMDPRTGQLLGAGSAAAIGQIVPNSGTLMNGIVRAGDGISKYNYTWPRVLMAPRFGLAYDLTGRQRMVLRGGVGLFHDRPAGDTMYSQVGNPGFSTSRTVRYAQLQQLSSGLEIQGPPQLTSVWPYEADVPSSTQWNAGLQMTLPWASTVDVSYVGQHGFNQLREIRGQDQVDINAVDLGAAFLPQNQDRTLAPSNTPGATAYSTDILRPYRGLGQLGFNSPDFHETYHSIQASWNRRFRDGIAFGANYTLGLAWNGNIGLLRRLQHEADGSYSLRPDQAEYEKMNKDMGNRRHLLKANFLWDLPNMSSTGGAMQAIGLLVNDWQISGIVTAVSGARYDISYAYQDGTSNVNLTGSPSYPARIRIVGDTGGGCSDNQYAQFSVNGFAGPQTGSLGLESGRNYLAGCPDHTVDLSVARNIRLGGSRQIQFRVDVYNALNTVVYNGRVTQLQLNAPSDPTVRNAQYLPSGDIDPTRLTPRNAGFGAVTGAQAMRSVQAQIRFGF